MLKVLYWLLIDAFFIFALFAFRDGTGGYIVLFLAAIAYCTWGLICQLKEWLK